MNDGSGSQSLFLSKPGETADSSRSPGSGAGLPPVVLAQAVQRLRVVSIVCAGLATVSWLVPMAILGRLAIEFQNAAQWGPIVLVIGSSLSVYLLSRGERVSATVMINIGLLYQVVVSFGIAGSVYFGVFEHVDPQYISFDLIGMSPVAVWMLFYTILVPARPRNALIALLGSASAVPTVYLIMVAIRQAPAIGASQFFFTFMFPYLFSVAGSYIAARIVYRLGKDLGRARQMGSYRLETLLGRGGMGEVWRARHRMLARPAAVKLIRREALHSADDPSGEKTLQRFEREAQATASLRSPHVVELYDFGLTEEGTFYSVMELLEGLDLQRLVERFGPLPPERVLFFLEQVCHALGESHDANLIHRDIKPANLYACRFGREYDFIKVLDFGLVRTAKGVGDQPGDVTQVGGIAGTPTYMAPETIVGGEADARTDLYALGCVAYWLLTGQTVFETEKLADLMLAHIRTTPIRPSQRAQTEFPPDVDDLVLWCLNKEASARPQTADELKQRLIDSGLSRNWTPDRAQNWWQKHLSQDDAVPGESDLTPVTDDPTAIWPQVE